MKILRSFSKVTFSLHSVPSRKLPQGGGSEAGNVCLVRFTAVGILPNLPVRPHSIISSVATAFIYSSWKYSMYLQNGLQIHNTDATQLTPV